MSKSDGYSNRELTREMIVGTFIGISVLVLVTFTIVISGSRLFSGGRNSMHVHFDEVGGLRRHDFVLVRGMPVGKVKSLELNDRGVEVILTLDERVNIREGYRVKIMQSSLLGGMQLEIEEGDGDILPPEKDIIGEPPSNVMVELGALVADLRVSLNEGGILTNIEAAVADVAEVTGRLRRGEGTLGRLLSSDDTLYRDTEAAIASIRQIAGGVERGEGTLGKLLSTNDTVYADLQGTMGNLRQITDRLEQGQGTLGRLLAEDDALYNDLAATVASLKEVTGRLERGEGPLGKLLSKDAAVYNDLADTIASLKAVTGRLEAGEGLLGQLMKKDSSITTDLEGLLKDGRDMVDDMREVSPISTFSSIFFGAF